MRLKRKDLIIITVLISMCLVTLVGSSYALFTRTFTSTKKISVQAGTLKVDFAEGNRINLSNVAPMSDSDGMNTTPYTFTITNNGSVAAYYTIRNEEDSSNILNNKYIKYRLISDSYDSGIKTLDTMGSGYYMLSSENTLAVGKSITYKLYLWLSSEADNDAQNKTYQSKIVVQSTTNSISETVATTLLNNGVGDNGSIDASDPEQTFITGTNPNNYIWYSGKLWRAVSIDPGDNSVKLVTQWSITHIPYNKSDDSKFENSYAEQWLNDTTADGFLGNLRDPEKFIKTDSVWNATIVPGVSKPSKNTMITATVGLLNAYEYTISYNGVSEKEGYLMNSSSWWTITPTNDIYTRYIDAAHYQSYAGGPASGLGIRPAINLKGNIGVSKGDGTYSNPYQLLEDANDSVAGTLLSTRYSGEYLSFGIGENNLYQIVSHENGYGTKITIASPLKENNSYKILSFDLNNSSVYSQSTTIGSFLNNEYLSSKSYFTDEQVEMIEKNSTWYLGKVGDGSNYQRAKYSDYTNKILTKDTTECAVGLLRFGELLSAQMDTKDNNVDYVMLSSNLIHYTNTESYGRSGNATTEYGIKPAMNLKSNVVITGGDGTKNNPFTVALQ